MLAVVKEPHIELAINGAANDVDALMEFIKKKYDVTIVVIPSEHGAEQTEELDDDDEYMNVFETDFWRETTPGDLLAGTRLKHELTQKRLAELSGISYATISAYERGKQPLSRRAAVRLAKAMDEDPESFFKYLPKQSDRGHSVN